MSSLSGFYQNLSRSSSLSIPVYESLFVFWNLVFINQSEFTLCRTVFNFSYGHFFQSRVLKYINQRKTSILPCRS